MAVSQKKNYSPREKKKARDLYVVRGLSYQEVRARVGVSKQTVITWSNADSPQWPQARVEYRKQLDRKTDQINSQRQAGADAKTDDLIATWRDKIDRRFLTVNMRALRTAETLAESEEDPSKLKSLVEAASTAYNAAKPLLEVDDDSKATRKRLEIVVVQEAIEKPQEVKDIESALTGTDDSKG